MFSFDEKNNFECGEDDAKTGGNKSRRIRPASASTSIPEDHDGGSGSAGLAAGPALSEVWAPGLLAHRVELELPELSLDCGVLGAPGDGLLHPLGLGERPLLGPDLHGVDKVGKGGCLLGEAPAEVGEGPGRGRLRGAYGLYRRLGGGGGQRPDAGEGSGGDVAEEEEARPLHRVAPLALPKPDRVRQMGMDVIVSRGVTAVI